MAPFRVVLAEDVDDMRLLYRTILNGSEQFIVEGEAADGEEAIARVAAVQPDVVLLDLSMPRMNGLDALPHVRRAAPDARVVILSGFDRDRLWPLVRAQGAVGYLEKGVPAAKLIDELLVVCGALELIEATLGQASKHVEADLQSAGQARRFLEELLDRWNCDAQVEVVKLAVTELVTNAVTHAESDANISVRLTPAHIRVEVADHGAALPQRRDVPLDAESGRGLAILDSMVERWGTEVHAGGKTVWFEVPRMDGASVTR